MFQVLEVDEWFVGGEVIAVGMFSGVLLPVVVLLPVIESVPMADEAYGMMLGMLVLLLSVWVPLLLATFWARVAVADREAATGADARVPQEERVKAELKRLTLALFFMLSVPLGLFVPVLEGTAPEPDGEAAAIFFLLFSLVGAFYGVVARRVALRVHVGLGIGARADTVEAMVKLLFGCCLLPMCVLLPVYSEATLSDNGRRTLLLYMLGLPPFTVLEAVRCCHHRERRVMLPLAWAVDFFGLVMPLGVLYAIGMARRNILPAAVAHKIYAEMQPKPGAAGSGHSLVQSRGNYAPLPAKAGGGMSSSYQAIGGQGTLTRSRAGGVSAAVSGLAESARLLPPRDAGGDWEETPRWRISSDTGELEPFGVEGAVRVRDGEGEFHIGSRFVTYPVEFRGDSLKYVLKWPVHPGAQPTRQAAKHRLQQRELAVACAAKFNEALEAACPGAPAAGFTPCFAVQLPRGGAADGVWCIVEKDLCAEAGADFQKWNFADGNVASIESARLNTDRAGDPDWEREWAELCDLAQAFSLYSYHASGRHYVITDIQGVSGKWTGPRVHYTGGRDPFHDPENEGGPTVQRFVDAVAFVATGQYATAILESVGPAVAAADDDSDDSDDVAEDSEIWGHWEAGMACQALFDGDGKVYPAEVVSVDWESTTAVVKFDGVVAPSTVSLVNLYAAENADYEAATEEAEVKLEF